VTHSQRRHTLKERIGGNGLDAMLVTDLNNVRYLSGFTGSNGALLVLGDAREAVLATDGRYRTQAAEQAAGLEVAIERAVGRHLVGRAAEAGVQKLGFESNVVTVDGFDVLKGELEDRKASTELVRAAGTVEALREVKDAGEVALLRLACEAADAALFDLVERGGLRPGRTEREVARDLEGLMFDHGADAISFETIVAAGPNSAIPHHRPSDAVLADGDFVKIDFGALVAEAQRAGGEALRAGASLREVDGAARRLIDDAGYAENFGHGLGHGVGLEIHEAPGIGATSAGTLLAGSVVTVEPGVYLPGRGGVRIEDTLVVPNETPGHTPDLLTRFPKELAVLT